MNEKLKQLGKHREISQTKDISAINADDIIRTMCDYFKTQEQEIFKNSKRNVKRQLAIYLIKRYTTLKLREIRKMFGLDYTSISVAAKRFENEMKREAKVARIVREIVERLGADD